MNIESREKLIDTFFTKEDDSYGFLYQTHIIQEQDDEEFTTSFIIEYFKFCGCGSIPMVIDYINDVLNCFDDRSNFGCNPYLNLNKIKEICHEDDNIIEFILHYLDAVELTEHGSSVYGSWLTEKGIALKDYLNEYWKGEEK